MSDTNYTHRGVRKSTAYNPPMGVESEVKLYEVGKGWVDQQGYCYDKETGDVLEHPTPPFRLLLHTLVRVAKNLTAEGIKETVLGPVARPLPARSRPRRKARESE